MTTLPVSSAYRDAIKSALILQVITTMLLLTVLDGGTLARSGAAAMMGFWIGVAIVMIRRPKTPTDLDLLYVRYGYLLMLIVGILLSPYLGVFRDGPY